MKPKKLTPAQIKRGYEVALAALKAVGNSVAPSYAAIYANDVVKNLENGNFLKPDGKTKKA